MFKGEIMKLKVIALALLMSAPSFANYAVHCGKIETIRTWGNGNDTYGIFIEYENNPASCSRGFYLKHAGNNKTFVFSQALAAKSTDTNVCIQVYTLANIANRCQLNYFSH